MGLEDILKLGDPRLYQKCEALTRKELPQIIPWAQTLDSLILQFRATYGAGRAIAAPQIGIMKRLVCMHLDEPVVFINPVLSNLSEEMIELWDGCMCFPLLLVKLRRHKRCTITFRDLNWNEHTWQLENDHSELLQHEVDHLDGILAIQRALDHKSFRWRTYNP